MSQAHRDAGSAPVGFPAPQADARLSGRIPETALRGGLHALSLALTAEMSLEQGLLEVARITAQAIHGADGAGVALMDPVSEPVLAASVPFVREIDAIQYRLGQGPCIEAVATDSGVRSGSLPSDRRWPAFAVRVGGLGAHAASSSLSLPLRVPGRTIGSLNVYARAQDVFDVDSQRRGEDFAEAAAVTVANMQALTRAHAYAAHLEATMAGRSVVDQAIGILRSRTGASTAEALDTIRAMSQRENKKLTEVADRLVGQSASRARARRAEH